MVPLLLCVPVAVQWICSGVFDNHDGFATAEVYIVLHGIFHSCKQLFRLRVERMCRCWQFFSLCFFPCYYYYHPQYYCWSTPVIALCSGVFGLGLMAICWRMGFPSCKEVRQLYSLKPSLRGLASYKWVRQLYSIKHSMQGFAIPECQEKVRCTNSFGTAAVSLDRLMGICK